jgi:hypothetical protein
MESGEVSSIISEAKVLEWAATLQRLNKGKVTMERPVSASVVQYI